MPWHDLLVALYNYLAAAGITVQQGLPDEGKALSMDGGALTCVSRVSEEMPDVYSGGEGSVTLGLDFIIVVPDADMATGYTKLAALEAKAIDQVKAWAEQDVPCKDCEVMQVKFGGSGGNPNVDRPVVASYLDIDITYSLRTM